MLRARDLGGDNVHVRLAPAEATPDISGHGLAGDAAVDRGIGDAVTTKPVGAVNAASILACNIEAVDRRGRVDLADNAAHQVVRGRHDFDDTAGEIEATVGATLDHALELLTHLLRPEMSHGDVEAAVRRRATGLHLPIHGLGNEIARRALTARVVVEHEALLRAVEQITASATQTFLDDRAGHARVAASKHAGRMELHHLHVAQAEPEAQRHGETVHRLVAGGRVVLVHGRAAAGAEQHGFGLNQPESSGTHVDEKHGRNRLVGFGRTTLRRDERHRAVFFQAADRPRPDLLHQPVDDFDAGEIALVNGAIEGLAGECFAV